MSAHRSRPAETTLRGTVLFVHGLWMTGAESFLLRRRLAARGWALRVLPYSSMAEQMDVVARRCARQAITLARRTLLPVHLVGHSLGGLVIHRMFEMGVLAADRFSGDFCRVVFMGTPIRGSQCARRLHGAGAARRLLGTVGAGCLPEGVPGRWEFPVQLGIVSGTAPIGLGHLLTRFDGPNDGTVAVTETQLEGATDRLELPVSHTTMCVSREVAERVADFLETGRFNGKG
ncbi:MAG TPA: alpha/beta fold hydrolase [Steroidobacteraceae bacterium]|nr:alpha/beta fold hydrolase [Steroidobacteraceae bacterium]